MSYIGSTDRKIKYKKAFTIVGLCIGILLALAIAYVIYVMAFYHRIPDKQVLELVPAADVNAEIAAKVNTGEEYEYTIVTYNVGFGAYSPDYSFFMDGGKSSWAKSKESATALITGAGELSLSFEPDFVLFQEIDYDSTRTYHLDEYGLLKNKLSEYMSVRAVNYDSAFLLYPFYEPHGSSKSGIATFSKYEITGSVRRSLPVSNDFNRFLDLDRCYTVSRLNTDNGKELVIINIHMSAYGRTEAVRSGQIMMLCEEMQAEYDKGNYVIVGGDFNHNLKIYDDHGNMGWAKAYDRSCIPDAFTFAIDLLDEDFKYNMHNSCRDAGKPYSETNSTVTLDGFIISDNIKCIEYENIDEGFAYSDHDPVVMRFVLE